MALQLPRLARRRLGQFAGQPVEQFRMRRPFAAEAEIARRGDDALAEMVLPEAIDHHAGRERMLRAGDPPGQFDAAFWLDFGGCQHAWEGRVHWRKLLLRVAALEDECLRRVGVLDGPGGGRRRRQLRLPVVKPIAQEGAHVRDPPTTSPRGSRPSARPTAAAHRVLTAFARRFASRKEPPSPACTCRRGRRAWPSKAERGPGHPVPKSPCARAPSWLRFLPPAFCWPSFPPAPQCPHRCNAMRRRRPAGDRNRPAKRGRTCDRGSGHSQS